MLISQWALQQCVQASYVHGDSDRADDTGRFNAVKSQAWNFSGHQPCRELRDKIPWLNLKTKSICIEAKFHQSVKYLNPFQNLGLWVQFITSCTTSWRGCMQFMSHLSKSGFRSIMVIQADTYCIMWLEDGMRMFPFWGRYYKFGNVQITFNNSFL